MAALQQMLTAVVQCMQTWVNVAKQRGWPVLLFPPVWPNKWFFLRVTIQMAAIHSESWFH